MRPLVASGEKPNVFFSLLDVCLLNSNYEYNLNFDNILVKNSNLVFQPIWQPYDAYTFTKYISHLRIMIW